MEEKVNRIFPSGESALRLVGSLLAERHEEWPTGRVYLTVAELYEWREKQTGKPVDEQQSESSTQTLQLA